MRMQVEFEDGHVERIVEGDEEEADDDDETIDYSAATVKSRRVHDAPPQPSTYSQPPIFRARSSALCNPRSNKI